MSATASITGLASGLKTDEIISKLMEIARQPQNNLKTEKTTAQSKLTAWQDLNTRVLALKMKCDSLSTSSSFGLMQTVSSNKDIVTATATTSAIPGDYYLKVVQRAQAHQVASQSGAFTSTNDVVGTGTVTFTLNNGNSFQVTLDSNNNTLGGLKDAINKAGKGVSASIMNAGTATSPDYRLILTSTATGVEAGMKSVAVNLTGGTAPSFNIDSPVQQAQNAKIIIGGGANTTPITVEKSTNTITDVIPGVTLNIASADENTTVKISVSRDIASVKQKIQDFVSMYNSLMSAIKEQTSYDSASNEGGVLLGDSQLQSVQMQIESALGAAVDGLSTQFRSLAAIGITSDSTGTLNINDEELTAALNDHPGDVARLFDSDLDSTSSYVSYIAATPDTKGSGAAGWSVSITQAARRAQITAGAEMSAALDADETLSINGTSITLTGGMTIDEVISAINSYSSKTNVVALRTGADGTGTGNYITLRRVQYGSTYDITVYSSVSNSSGNTSGIGTVVAKASEQGLAGLDVKGTINGEEATGSGQTLSLKSSKNAANGLSLLVTTATPLESVNVKFTKGIGSAMRDLLVTLSSTNGALSTAQQGITDYINDLDDQISDMDTSLANKEAALWTQFNSMESQLAKLQAQGNYITAQLNALNNSNSK
jgi:flagellar hook-associated protein 2